MTRYFILAGCFLAIVSVCGAIRSGGGDTRRDELGAVVYVPEGYNGEPIPVLYWLHWYRGNAYSCPPMDANPNFIVVAPKFNRDAVWKEFDLPALIKQVEAKYPASTRWLEGYSRGANGAVYWASKLPGTFSKVRALAGSYPEPVATITDPLIILGGRHDDRWGSQSKVYADSIGAKVVWVDSTHNPTDFYNQLNWAELYN